MSTLYDQPETLATVQTPLYAAQMFTWGCDTLTDLRSYFDLTDHEYDTFRVRAEWRHLATFDKGDTGSARPTCDSCGEAMVARIPRTPEQAWCGMWWDHPIIPGQVEQPGIGHTASKLVPAPSERSARAAQAHEKAGGRA